MSPTMTIPTLSRNLDITYEAALKSVPEALKSEGFGVLTEIDVAATLKKKIDVDFRRYMILGACNPSLAHRALETDLAVGVLLPCNVVIYEGDDGNAVVTAIEPMSAIGSFGGEALKTVADEVKQRLERVISSL